MWEFIWNLWCFILFTYATVTRFKLVCTLFPGFLHDETRFLAVCGYVLMLSLAVGGLLGVLVAL